MNENINCVGCSLSNKIAPVNVVFENDFVCCILDHDPFNEGHVMIISKKHFEDVDELDPDTANEVIQAARLLSKVIKVLDKPDGITICQNGGLFSELTHFHMHVVPRYKHQSFADFYLEEPLNNQTVKSKLLNTRNEFVEVIKKII